MPATLTADTLLDRAALARRLNISTRHLDNLESAGRIGPMPIWLGKAKRFNPVEIERWISAGCPNRDRWLAIQAQQDDRPLAAGRAAR